MQELNLNNRKPPILELSSISGLYQGTNVILYMYVYVGLFIYVLLTHIISHRQLVDFNYRNSYFFCNGEVFATILWISPSITTVTNLLLQCLSIVLSSKV